MTSSLILTFLYKFYILFNIVILAFCLFILFYWERAFAIQMFYSLFDGIEIFHMFFGMHAF